MRLVLLAAAILVVLALVPRLMSRRHPNGKSATPRPWNPELGPFTPARGSYEPEVPGLVATGIVTGALVLAFRGDSSIAEIVARSVGFVAAMFVIGPDRFSDALQFAESAPSDAPVDRSRAPRRSRAFTLEVVTLALVVVGAVFHLDATFLAPAALLGRAYVLRARERTLARWEDEHGVEFVRLPGSGRIYARHEGAGGDHPAREDR